MTTNDPQFAISGLSATSIAPLGTATFVVTFTPTSSGAKSAIITASSSNTTLGNTPIISLTGTGDALPSAPIVGTITNPSCGTATGSVALSGLPTTPWTVTASPGGAFITGSTATATFSGLTAGTTYTFKVTSGCTSVASSSAVIGPDLTNTISLTSAMGTDAQSVCISTMITPISYATTGATGAVVIGLPPGVVGFWVANSVVIGGSPTNDGTFNYTITLTGGCGTVTKTGIIKVSAVNNTISLTSAVGTDAQTPCFNTAITPITYATTGASDATVSGLPTGVTGSFSTTTGVLTISGTPTVAGNFSYTVTLTGGCGNITASGTINVGAATAISYAGTPYCATGTASVTQSGETGGAYSSTLGLTLHPTTGEINLASSTPGTYTVSYTYGGTCGSTVTTTVKINELPVATLSPLSPSACVGTPITINSSITTTKPDYIHAWSVVGNYSALTTGGPSSLTTSSATFTGNEQQSVVVNYSVTDGNGCISAPVSTTVDVKAPPVATTAGPNQTKCEDGSFTLAASMAGQPVGAVGTWSGAGVLFADVNDPTTTATGLVDGTSTTLTWTVTNGVCTSTSATVTLTNQIVRLSSPLTATACSGTPFIYTATSVTPGASFTWTRATVAGISNAAVTNGVGNVTETLINTTSAPIVVTYLYTTSANACSNLYPEVVVVTVNPKPAVNNLTHTMCGGAGFSLTPADGTNGLVPTGTTYTWTTPSVTGGLTGGAAETHGSSDINGTLYNPTNAVQLATYTVTPTANGCAGATFTVTVTVKANPAVTNMTTAICTGSFSVTPVNGTNGFVPSGTTYTWTTPSVTGAITGGAPSVGSTLTSISGSLSNLSTTDETATYTVTPTSNGCTGLPFTVTVTVKATPSLSSPSSIAAICSGANAAYSPASITSGATFSWTRPAIVGITEPMITGSGGFNEQLTNTTTDPITVTYEYITSANGCSSPVQNVTVVVYPKPKLNTIPPQSTCSGSPYNLAVSSATVGTTFSWTRAAVTNITPSTGAGSNNVINETLTNSTTAPITVVYVFTMTANGCTNTGSVSVVVNPTPVLSSTLTPTAICSGATFGYTATSATTGATFGWVRATVAGITEVGTTGGPNVSETLTNTTANPIVVTYVYTVTANGCTNTQNVTVTVNPIPKLSSSLTATAICSGTTAAYTATSATAGATFAWSRAAVAGISQAAGSGSGNVSEILTNTTSDPITVTYVYVTSANGCSSTQNVTLVVNPKLVLSSTLTPAAVCSGTTFGYTATSLTAGTVFSWSRATVSGISEVGTSGSNAVISETLTNTTNAAITVTYVYIMTANGCSNAQNITVVVNPMPSIIPTTMTAAICSGGTFAIFPQNGTNGIVPAGTTYSWSAPSVSGVSGDLTGGAGGSGASIINGTLTNTTTSVQTATYTVTPTVGTCAGTPFTVSVTVNPKPSVADFGINTCSGSAFTATPTGVPLGTTYSWTAPSVTGASGDLIGGVAANGQSSFSGNLTNTTTSDQTATYTITPTSGTCVGAPFTVTVVVHPTPAINNFTKEVCSGGSVLIKPLDGTHGRIPTGTTYSWPGGGSGNTTIILTLNNLTSSPITATYSITPTVGTCSGNPFTITITAYPIPTISGVLSVCEDATTTLTGSGTPNASTPWVSATPSVATVSALGVVTGVAAGTAVITYTDNKGCTITATVTVNAKPKATLTTATGAEFISQGACVLTISSGITVGMPPYTPNAWSSASTLLQFSSLTGMSTDISSSTSTAVTVPTTAVINFVTHDANGCYADAKPLTITIYPQLKANITGANKLCIAPSALATITLDAGISGGYAAGTSTAYPLGRTIVWSSSNTAVATVSQTGVVSGVAAGSTTISVVVTDANGCSATSTMIITVNDSPVSTATVNNVSCNGANDGIICLATSGASPFTYAWSNVGSGTSNCNAGLAPATYAVTTTDNNGCTSSLSGLVITQPGAISATMTGATAVCQLGTAPSVTFTGAGGTAPYTFAYSFNNGTTTSNFTVTTTSGNSVNVSQSTAATGTFTYTLLSVTSGVCTKTQTGSVVINIGTPITGVTAGPDQLAVGASTTLAGNLGTGTSGVWSIVAPIGSTATFSAATSATSTVSNLPFGLSTLRWTVSNTGGCTVSDDVDITRSSLKVAIIAALEGPLNSITGEMYTNIKAIIPADGSGYPNATVRAVTGLSAIVDWVTVELRTTGNVPATGNNVRQGLIRADGKIVEPSDGTSPLKFDVPDGNYFISIKHRNHIDFRSWAAESITAAGSPSDFLNPSLIFDFATGQTLAFGTNSLKLISGVYCAYSGDSNLDGTVDSDDYNQWRPMRFQSGYLSTDFNLDGTVNSIDYNLWLPNRFRTEQF